MELICIKEVVKGIYASLVVLVIMAVSLDITVSFDIIAEFITFGYIVPFADIIEMRIIMGIMDMMVHMVLKVVNLIQVKIDNLNQDIMVETKEEIVKVRFLHNFIEVGNRNHCEIKTNRNPGYKLSFKFQIKFKVYP
jgi:hypothetical protein